MGFRVLGVVVLCFWFLRGLTVGSFLESAYNKVVKIDPVAFGMRIPIVRTVF